MENVIVGHYNVGFVKTPVSPSNEDAGNVSKARDCLHLGKILL